MKRVLLVLLLLVAVPALAVGQNDCSGPLTQLGALYQIRSMMLHGTGTSYDIGRFIDRRMDDLREPLSTGGYRWVRWVRPSGEGTSTKAGHDVMAGYEHNDRDSFEASGDHTYAVRIAVPRKRSLLKANNPVWVGIVHIEYSVDGRTRTKEQPINAWMNPDTSRTIDLGAIADHAQVLTQVATMLRNAKQAVVEVHFRQAVAQDDPANPNYATIQMLQRLREAPDARIIDAEILSAESKLFPGSESVPLLTIIGDLRRADELMRSQKSDEQEKGSKLLKETLKRLR